MPYKSPELMALQCIRVAASWNSFKGDFHIQLSLCQESRINSPRDGWSDQCSIIKRHSCSWNDSYFYFLWSFITTGWPWCIYESGFLGLLALVNVQDSSDWQASFFFRPFYSLAWFLVYVCICVSPFSHPLLQTAKVRWGAWLPMHLGSLPPLCSPARLLTLRTVLCHSPACVSLQLPSRFLMCWTV